MSRQLTTLILSSLLGGLLAHAQTPRPPKTVPPAAILADNMDNQSFRIFLEEKYPRLRQRWVAWMQRAETFNLNFAHHKFKEGSPEAAAGAKEQAWLSEELETYGADADRFALDINKLDIDRGRSIALMIAKAERLKLGHDKVEQARKVMLGLRLDGDTAAKPEDIAAIWQAVEARNGDATIAAEAAAGDGPTLFNSGTQASYNDCTIFALASAMGRPYGLVATEATQMLRDAEWRGLADRNDPVGVLKHEGLNGDEVTLLAAAYGQTQLVSSGSIAQTLREGYPVLVSVKLTERNSVYFHQVVLSRTFQHHDETWFEMVDSHLGSNQRRYLSQKELFTVLLENGLSYRPDQGRVPVSLKF